MDRVAIDGVELEYTVAGRGEPVLFIHGSVVANGFLPLMAEAALTDRFQVVGYNRRGYAGSTHATEPVSIGDQAADAAGLLTRLGIAPAHVAGHSYGGVIALQLALERPELVRSLALLEPALMQVPSAAAYADALAPTIEAYAAGDKAKATVSLLSYTSGLDPEQTRAAIDAALPDGIDQAINDIDTFFQLEAAAVGEWAFGPEQAAAIHAPTLSVLGGDSKDLHIEGRTLLDSWFSEIDHYTLPGTGHLLHMVSPAPLAAALADFFSKHPC